MGTPVPYGNGGSWVGGLSLIKFKSVHWYPVYQSIAITSFWNIGTNPSTEAYCAWLVCMYLVKQCYLLRLIINDIAL